MGRFLRQGNYHSAQGSSLQRWGLSYKNLKPLESTDFREDLKDQFRFLSVTEREFLIETFLIESINEKGFMDMDTDILTIECSFKYSMVIELQEVEKIKALILGMEPLGIGCRDLQEYYLLQLSCMSADIPNRSAAIILIRDHYNNLQKRKWKEIQLAMDSAGHNLEAAITLIAQLKKVPVSANSSAPSTARRM